MNKELEDVLHEEGLTQTPAEKEESWSNLADAEHNAWRVLYRALGEHFMHSCKEGTCDTSYGDVKDALFAAMDAGEALMIAFDDGEDMDV